MYLFTVPCFCFDKILRCSDVSEGKHLHRFSVNLLSCHPEWEHSGGRPVHKPKTNRSLMHFPRFCGCSQGRCDDSNWEGNRFSFHFGFFFGLFFSSVIAICLKSICIWQVARAQQTGHLFSLKTQQEQCGTLETHSLYWVSCHHLIFFSLRVMSGNFTLDLYYPE